MIRGLIMILMALDHFIYFINRFHPAEFWITAPPVFPSPAYAVFRLLSHLCAPGFVLLAGTSLVLFVHRKNAGSWAPSRIRRSLITRGIILLVVVQFGFEQLGWALGELGGRGFPLNASDIPGSPAGPTYGYLGVVYVLSVCMIAGSLLYQLRTSILAILAGTSLVASPIVLSFVPSVDAAIHPVLNALFVPGLSVFFTNYPLFPWLGVFLVGMILGRTVLRNSMRLPDRIWMVGVGLVAGGAALRLIHPWGESHPVEPGRLASFLELSKYPPSLAFIAITLGLLGLVGWLFQRLESRPGFGPAARFLEVYGREPLFFYILHLQFYALVCFLVVLAPVALVTVGGWLLSLAVFAPILVWFARLKSAGKLPRLLGWL
jgi:uncharacterized membrane protein